MRLLLLSLLLSYNLSAFHPPLEINSNSDIVDGKSLKRDSGIRGPSWNEQIQIMHEFSNRYPEISEVISYGYTVQSRQLTALLLRKPAPFATTRFTLITGATHGNEYLNIVDRLSSALMSSPDQELMAYLNRGGSVLFVPIVNPDGYDRRTRSNGNRVDLNRDWPNPGNGYKENTQPETKALNKWLKNYITADIKMDIAMDYHCCVDGMLLLPWGWKKGLYMSSNARAKSQVIEKMMTKHFKKPGEIGTPPDTLYAATGTTLDFWHEKFKAISFTYEGRFRSEKKYLTNHVNWWNEIFKGFN